jgi:hypothetical protein
VASDRAEPLSTLGDAYGVPHDLVAIAGAIVNKKSERLGLEPWPDDFLTWTEAGVLFHQRVGPAVQVVAQLVVNPRSFVRVTEGKPVEPFVLDAMRGMVAAYCPPLATDEYIEVILDDIRSACRSAKERP